MMKSRKHEQYTGDTSWSSIGEGLVYWKTDVQRSGWRIPGPINLDDEEDDDEILDDLNGVDGVEALQD